MFAFSPVLRLRVLLIAGLIAITSLTSSLVATAQTTAPNEWTWMGGSDTANQPGVYPVSQGLSTASTTNIPGSRNGAVSWTDKDGNLWLFGGQGHDSAGNLGYLNDLWEFNSSTGAWAWMGGSNVVPTANCTGFANVCSGQSGVYGTSQTFAAGNIPGGRKNAASWTDSNGNLWLFGGQGYDSADNFDYLNDLWEFNPTLGTYGEWAWMGGTSTLACTTYGSYTSCTSPSGVYGQKGTFAAGNIPGSRSGAVSWTDKNGNFWLFGGAGNSSNDLWEFSPTLGTAGEWAWMSGSNSGISKGTYGTLGTPGGVPGSRSSATGWTDSSGNLWLFGGNGYGSSLYLSQEGHPGDLNDLWEYIPSTSQWTWMGGSSDFVDDEYILGSYAVYGTLGQPAATNVPGGRHGMAAWKDSSGNFWLFGGNGFSAENSNGLRAASSYGQAQPLNDLWEYSPTTNEWTWMGGQNTMGCSGICELPGVYGTLLTPAFANNPGSRQGGVSWTDNSGKLWLFGGTSYVYGGTSYLYYAEFPVDAFNDLWESQSTTDTRPVTPAPTFSPATGSYTSTQSVTISDSDPKAIIYISNSDAPTNASTIYKDAVPVAWSQTLQAVAQSTNSALSPVATATYSFNLPVVATPAFSLMGAGVADSVPTQYVTLSDTTPGAQIYYSYGPLTPYIQWRKVMSYTGNLTIASGQTLYAIAAESGYADSAIASVTYPVTLPAAAAPTFNLTPGTYTSIQSVPISDTTPGASIYYTINGSTPCTNSTCNTNSTMLYSGPVTVPETMTITAIAVAPGYSNSTAASASYTFTPANLGGVKIGSSATASVIVVIPAAATLDTLSVVTEGAANQDFTNAGGGTCAVGASYTAMSACTVNVSFAPRYAGARYGAVVLYDASGKVIGTGYVQGTGQGPQIIFTSSATQPSIAVNGFIKPFGMTADTNGNLFVNDSIDSTQYTEYLYKEKLQPNGTYLRSTLAQMVDGKSAMAVDGAGNVYDHFNGVAAEIPTPSGGYTPNSWNSTIAGVQAVDGAGNVYQMGQQHLYRPGLGSGGTNYVFGRTLTPILLPPSSPGGNMWGPPYSDVAVDGSGNVYTTAVIPPNVDNPASCWLSSGPDCYYESVGEQFWSANPPTSGGLSFSALLGADYYYDFVIAVDKIGNAYFTAQAFGNGQQSYQQAFVYRAALQPDNSYTYTRIGSGWVNPIALATDGLGNAYVLDAGATPSPAVYKFDYVNPPALAFASTGKGSTSADSPQTVTITNYGNLPLQLSGITVPADFSLNNSVANTCTGSTSLAALQSCVLSISFTPVTPLNGATSIAQNESIVITSNTLNTASTTSTIKVRGTESLPVVTTPTISLAAGTYAPGQSVTLSDTTPGATIYYAINGTPVVGTNPYSGAITVNTTETIQAVAVANGYTNSALASAAYIIEPPASMPTFSVAAGTYNSVQLVSISDTTPGAIIYYTTNGTIPTTSSTQYHGAITVSVTETLEAIATANNYSLSGVATSTYTILPANPVPVITGISPGYASAGGATFPLTVAGTGFISGSTVYWGASALTTTYRSATQLTAQVPAADIAIGGNTVAITVQTPSPGGGTSNAFQFEVNSASGATTGPTFTSTTATVTAGSSASYLVTLPSSVVSASVTCLNLPTGAACSYSATTNTLTITTSATTPKGTYQITVVFTETVSGAATGYILLPILLIPLLLMRRKLAARGVWITASLGLVLLASAAFSVIGCGGGSGATTPPPPPPQTHQVISSWTVNITIQ
jgi:N-acetylneuraminic acid mutarotase